MAKSKSAKSTKGAKSTKSGRSKKRTKLTAVKTIAILHSGHQNRHIDEVNKLKQALADAGYPSASYTIDDELYSDDDPQTLADNAYKLASSTRLDLIIAAGGTACAYAVADAQNKTGISTNVVFTSISQQNAPAPNMTGVNAQTSGLDVARMQYLYDIDKTQTTFGVLENQTKPNFKLKTLADWARSRKVTLDRHSVYKYADEPDNAVTDRINYAFDDWRKKNIKYAQVCADPIFYDYRKDVTDAANNNKITVIYQWKEFSGTAKPGDRFYGTDLMEAYAQAGKMAGQVLDLPDPGEIATIPVYTVQPQPLSVKRKAVKRSRKSRR